ncbi:MAG: MerR family transcriptional regulator [Sedimentibacter sp.]|uniref:MerR family transcriptional regulator n=1 Tax=Sedimentibacter sp. TaxID=1960295 RepID=UPI0031586888
MKQKYLVNEIAKYFGVSGDTIRHYDRLGIISPKKDEKNNYRYYSREDLICFSYVFELKDLGLPLKQIDKMLNNNTMEYAAQVLEAHEQEIEKQIEELKKLKWIINDYKQCIYNAIQNYDKINIAEDLAVVYKEIEQSESSLIDNLNLFKNLSMTHIPLFTFVVDKDLFLSDEFYNNVKDCRSYFKYALSLVNDENLASRADTYSGGFKVLNPRKCLKSVIKFYTHRDYSAIIRIVDYIRDNNLEIDGPVLLRAISFKNDKDNNYDFYEIYIPLK